MAIIDPNHIPSTIISNISKQILSNYWNTFIIVATLICPFIFSIFGADLGHRRETSTKDSSVTHSQPSATHSQPSATHSQPSSTMSIPEPSSSSSHNASLSQSNVSQLPRANQTSVNRFARAPASDGPYYAGARMQERSSHLTGLSNQVNAMDDILMTGKK